MAKRSQETNLADLAELSRKPHRLREPTPTEIENRILSVKAGKPAYGAKKILAVLWPDGAPLSVRTADRILKRHGLVVPKGDPPPEPQRFERAHPNELWQMDFKGLGLKPAYSPLSVLDDASRFCLALRPLPDHQSRTIFQALWEVFGDYGLPQALLSDNESCFADVRAKGPSWLEARLWLLGVRTLHGRPRHPQTQGKVERFHRTLELELGRALRQPSLEEARHVLTSYREEYNFERPHEALGQKPPGRVYRLSLTPRPAEVPEHEVPSGVESRNGDFTYQGVTYGVSKGLIGQRIVLSEAHNGTAVSFAGRYFALLHELPH